MTDNTGDTTEDVLDEFAVARPGDTVVFDEAGSSTPPTRGMMIAKFTELTPERMQKRIDDLERRFKEQYE